MIVKFSVITSVYNAEQYLNETLSNVAEHVGAQFEIIFIDDGSTDGSAQILAEFCDSHDYARLISSPHRGVSAARNLGIDAARGEYILFLDADDSFAEDIFAVLGGHIAQTRPDILVFGAKVINFSEEYFLEDITPREAVYEGFNPDILFKEKGARPYVWNCAYRTEFLRLNNIRFDEEISLGEDNLFQFAAYPCAKRVQFISEKLYVYNYLKIQSAMAYFLSDRVVHCRHHLLLVDKIISVLKQNSDFASFEGEFLKREYNFLRYDFNAIKGKDFKELSLELKKIHKKHGLLLRKIKDRKIIYRLYAFMHPWFYKFCKFMCGCNIVKIMRGIK